MTLAAQGAPIDCGAPATAGMTLPDALAALLSGRAMSVAEAARAVTAAGYPRRPASLYFNVAKALAGSGRFRRVGPGLYTARRGADRVRVKPVPVPRAPRPPSIGDRLAEMLRGREMTTGEAARALAAAGYRSRSKRLHEVVGARLWRDPRFRRVGWGRYTARPMPAR